MEDIIKLAQEKGVNLEAYPINGGHVAVITDPSSRRTRVNFSVLSDNEADCISQTKDILEVL